MNVILLSGGSGKRLWPLSNEIRSKQFLKIFKDDQGNYESMLQRVYRQIKSMDPEANVLVAAGKAQIPAIHNQLGSHVAISTEPCRKDTFPAIALAAAYLADIRKIKSSESVVVCPIDAYVDSSYFMAIKSLVTQVGRSRAKLILLGMEPTYPSEKYGYIIPESMDKFSQVLFFREKPGKADAKKYIAQGALWNGGVFAFQLQYMLDKAYELLRSSSYEELLRKYHMLDRISFDYAVVEKEANILVMRFSGQWKDVGTWNTLTEAMDSNIIGDAKMDDGCSNVHILNELDMPVLAVGLHNTVISASPEGILVSDKEQSSYIKPYVDEIQRQVRFAEKSWGSFLVIDVGEESLTIKVTLNPGHSMNYHSHDSRDEVWTVISGSGTAVVDGTRSSVKAGDVVILKKGCCHTIQADTELKLIEVQIGKEISVLDKKLYKNNI